MISIRRGLAAVLAAGIAVAAAGCSAGTPAGPSAAQVKAAVRDASSVHIAGLVTQGGEAERLDAGFLRTGDWDGTIISGATPPVSLIVAGGRAYVLLTQAFLQSVAGKSARCNGVCGKYLPLTGSQAAGLTSDISMTRLTGPLIQDLAGLKRTGTGTVNGRAVIVMRGSDGTVIDVAAHGRPYPLRIAGGTASGGEGTLTLSQWDKVPAPAAPSAAELISPSSL
jgi:hypothetical protein